MDKGRCEACSGEGYETVEMQFLADVALLCPVCRGRRFKEEVLAVRHHGLTVARRARADRGRGARALRATTRPLVRALGPVARLGLGYLPLGQPLSTLSGGEAQRLKLARALAERGRRARSSSSTSRARACTTRTCARCSPRCTSSWTRGASVVVVDHDLVGDAGRGLGHRPGPGRRPHGGRLVAEGTPEQLARSKGLTAAALRGELPEPVVPGKRGKGAAEAGSAPSRWSTRASTTCRTCPAGFPHGKLTVVTGPSGSGKSSLAFDVVFAEGQRRFLETLTPYARQFLPTMPRPDVERISGIPPSVALEQRTSRAGATSTVATVTEVAHYLRLLFAKLGQPHCPRDGEPIAATTAEALYAQLTGMKGDGTVLAPAVRARKGTYLDVFTAAARAGIETRHRRREGGLHGSAAQLAKTREHDIDLVMYQGKLAKLPREVFDKALTWGKGALKVRSQRRSEETLLSSERTCPVLRLRRAGAGPALVLLQHEAGPLRGLRGHRACEGGAEALAEGRSEPCRDLRGLAPGAGAARGAAGGRSATTRWCSSPSPPRWSRCAGWKFRGRPGAASASRRRQELLRRLEFLDRVGLGYLSLDRDAATLSGGEMQRLRLRAQLGAGLTGALYVLDEPTIGLHPRDTHRLLANLRALVDTGSTVLVVEHDTDTIRAADHLIDLGPTRRPRRRAHPRRGPAREGAADRGRSHGPRAPGARGAGGRPARGAPEKWIELKGARANNLKGVDLRLPVGRLTVVSGVSGSGKSTLVRQVLYPALREKLGLVTTRPGPFKSLAGVEAIRRVLARGPVAHRAHAALGAGHVPGHLGRAAPGLRRHARGQGARLQSRRGSRSTARPAAAARPAKGRAPSRTRCPSSRTSSPRARPAAGRASTRPRWRCATTG